MHKTNRILNVKLTAAITGLRWGEAIVIADAGLPVPNGVEVLDLSICEGKPVLEDLLPLMSESLTADRVIVATEMEKANKPKFDYVKAMFGEKFETMGNLEWEEQILPKAKLVVLTGETSPYGNVIFIGGLDFFKLGMAD